MTKVAIIGSGGHTRSSVNLLLRYFNSSDMSIYDNSFLTSGRERIVDSIQLVGGINDVEPSQSVFLSIGDNHLREQYFLRFKGQIIRDNVFHSSSLQEKDVTYGTSNQVFACSYVNSQVFIGDNNIVNTGAIIEHESIVGSHNHISIGSKMCGRSMIGDKCLLGAGSIVLPQVSICDNVTIGAGSVVTRNIDQPGVYVGAPARRVR